MLPRNGWGGWQRQKKTSFLVFQIKNSGICLQLVYEVKIKYEMLLGEVKRAAYENSVSVPGFALQI